jgi:hypothetical protein
MDAKSAIPTPANTFTVKNIQIGDTLLNYKYNLNKYIITYKENYNPILDKYINNIFDSFFPYYKTKELEYSNVCGANAEFICTKLKKDGLIKNLKIDGLILGKIIITQWYPKDHKIIKKIELVYGPINITIGASYHALAYLEVIIDEIRYYVAIETTLCIPYKLQFFVGSNKDEFENIIMTRYQCSEFKTSFDCDKSWIDIAYNGGNTLKYKSTGIKVYILYKNKKYKRTIYMKDKRKAKYCKINGEYILLSKMKVIEKNNELR